MASILEGNGIVNFDQALTDTRALWRQAVAVAYLAFSLKLMESSRQGRPLSCSDETKG